MTGVPDLAHWLFVGGIIMTMPILQAVFGRMGVQRRGE